MSPYRWNGALESTWAKECMPDLKEKGFTGNVLITPGSKKVSIIHDAAMNMKIGKRGQRKGLCFDDSMPGFEPASWPLVVDENNATRTYSSGEIDTYAPHVISGARTYSIDLGMESNSSTRLYISYENGVDPDLVGITRHMLDVHSQCRAGDGSGKMVGVGDHLRYDGHVGPFVTPSESDRRRVAGGMERAGRVFEKKFVGRGVGYEEMLAKQADVWPRGSPAWPLSWAASSSLTNSAHCDRDAARSFAVWMSLREDGVSESWTLLFPQHGVVVRLRSGAWISWDGRVQPHCSALAKVGEGDELLSLFCSLPANACRSLSRDADCGGELRERGEKGSGCGERGRADALLRSDAMRKGAKVMLRCVPEPPEGVTWSKSKKQKMGKEFVRWVKSRVHERVIDDTGVGETATSRMGWVDVREESSRGVTRVQRDQVWNRLVVGWVDGDN